MFLSKMCFMHETKDFVWGAFLGLAVYEESMTISPTSFGKYDFRKRFFLDVLLKRRVYAEKK